MNAVNESKGWCCYLLECADGSYYVGVATDLDDRLHEHQAGAGCPLHAWTQTGLVGLVPALWQLRPGQFSEEECEQRGDSGQRNESLIRLSRKKKAGDPGGIRTHGFADFLPNQTACCRWDVPKPFIFGTTCQTTSFVKKGFSQDRG